MKFLTDMGVSPRCVDWLRSQGYDAVHLHEQNLHAISDCEVLRKAHAENRILLTMDLDFAQLVSAVGIDDLPTVVIFRITDQRPQSVILRLSAMLSVIGRCASQGSAVLSVSDSKVRVRQLPIR